MVEWIEQRPTFLPALTPSQAERLALIRKALPPLMDTQIGRAHV